MESGVVTITLTTQKTTWLILAFFLELSTENTHTRWSMAKSDYAPDIKDSDNILNVYFDEAGQFPLLTLKEERELLSKYIKYRDNKKAANTRTRLKALEAREKLINCNLKLVIKIANEFKGLGMESHMRKFFFVCLFEKFV